MTAATQATTPTKSLIRYALRRAGVLPPRFTSIAYKLRRDNAVDCTVRGRQNIGGRIILAATFEVTAQGRIRLAYDAVTGEALAIN